MEEFKGTSNKKIFRNLIVFVLAFLFYLIFSSTNVYAAEGDVILSGDTGDCTYELTELANGNYKLTISGDGAMADYSSYSDVPWYLYSGSIEETEIEGNLTSIGDYAFYYCTTLTEIDLSNCTNLTSIGKSAFYYCTALIEINLSECTNLTTIGNYAFEYCTALTEVILSNCTNLTEIGNYAFYCTSLTEIDLSNCNSLTEISTGLFEDCELLEKVELPTSIIAIENYAFEYCFNLENIDFANLTKLTSIGGHAFYYCRNITEIELPSSIQTIGNYAFDYCSLINVELSNCTALESIGYYAFFSYHTNANEEVNMSLPKNTYLYLYQGALFDVYYEWNWDGSYGGEYYIDLNGIAWYMNSTNYEACLAFIPSGITTYTVPEYITYDKVDYTVIGIYNCALFYVNDLESIIFSNASNITWIDDLAFAYCQTLETINGYSTIDEINEEFENVEIVESMVEGTKINTKYDLEVEIDLYDWSYYMEDAIKEEVDISELTSIILQLYCNGEIAQEIEIQISDFEGSNWKMYTFEDLEIGNDYYIDIAHDNIGWGAGIWYYNSGNEISTYVYVNIGTKYAYTVSLEVEDESILDEIASLEVELYDEEGNLVATGTLSSDNNWSYVFYTKDLDYYACSYVSKDYTIKLTNKKVIYTYEISYDETIYEYYEYAGCYRCNGSLSYIPGATITLQSYTLKDATIDTDIGIEAIEIDGEEIVEGSSVSIEGQNITYEITYGVTIEDYEGDATITITDGLPYEIEEDYEYTIYVDGEEVQATEVTYENQALTWVVDVAGIDTYSDSTTGEIEIQILLKVTYVDSNYGAELWTNNVSGTVYLITTGQSAEEQQAEADTPVEIVTSVNVEKLWEDNDNYGDTRPEYITVELDRYDYGETEEYEIVDEINIYPETVEGQEVWAGTFENLPKYDASGNEYKYVVDELSSDGYKNEIVDNEDGTFTITNTLLVTSLEVTKTASITENAQVGDKILYTIEVKNTGNVTLTEIDLTDTIETATGNTRLQTYSDEDCTEDIYIIYNLEEGETATVYATYTITQDDIDGQTVITNTIIAENEDGTTDEDTVTTTPEGVTQQMEVTKTASITENADVGDVIVYTITITNTGNVTIRNIEIEDMLSNGTELTLYGESDYSEELSVIEDIGVGQTQTLYAEYTVTQDDIDNQETLVNTFTATAGSLEETATAETTVVEKTSDGENDGNTGDGTENETGNNTTNDTENSTTDNTSNTNTTEISANTDNTIASGILPNTGGKTIVIALIVIFVVGVWIFIKYRSYNDVK